MSLKIKINGAFLDMQGSDEIQVDYAVNRIGDLSTRQGVRSNNFTIPLTNKNKAAIGLNHILNNVGENINRRIDGVLYRSSTSVSKGFFQLTGVDIINKTGTLTFFSGNADWLDVIRGQKICELTTSLEPYNHLWNIDNAKSSFLNTQGYVYFACDNGRLSDRPLTSTEYGISSISNSSGFLKITTSSNHTFAIDDIIQLIEFDPDAVNSSYRVTSVPAADEVVIDLVFSPNISTDGSSLVRIVSGINLEDLCPAIFAHTIFRAIFQEAGFVIKGAFLDDPFFKSIIIPFAGDVVTNGNKYAEDYTSNLNSNVIYSFGDTYPGGATEDYLSEPIYTVPAELGAIKVTATVNVRILDFLVSLTATTSPATTAQLDASIAVTKNQTVILAEQAIGGVSSEFGGPTETDSFAQQSFSFEFSDLDLIAGDTLEIAILVEDGAASGATGTVDLDVSTRSIVVVPDFAVPQEGLVYAAEILPCIAKEDFVKWIALSFGLMFQVDNYAREIQVFTFEEVANGLAQANDWTSKIDSSEHLVSFTDLAASYSRENYMLYESDTNNTDNQEYENKTGYPFGSGFFEVDSDFVKDTSDLYTAPFSGSFIIRSLKGNGSFILLPHIQRYSSDELTYFEADVSPSTRALVYAGMIPVSDLSNGQVSTIDIFSEEYSNVPFAFFYKEKISYNIDAQNKSIAYSVQSVPNPNDYGFLELYWLAYRAAIDTNKYLTLSMRLNPVDISNLDFSKPVFLSKTGITGYYFIDQIEAYDGKQPTTVHFVKIGGDVDIPIIKETVIPRNTKVPAVTTPPVTQPCTGFAVFQVDQIVSPGADFQGRGWAIGHKVTVFRDSGSFTDTIADIDSFSIYLSSNIPNITFPEVDYSAQIDNDTLNDTIYTCAIPQDS